MNLALRDVSSVFGYPSIRRMPRQPPFFKHRIEANAWVSFHVSFAQEQPVELRRGDIAAFLLFVLGALCLPCAAQVNPLSPIRQAAIHEGAGVIARIVFLGNRRLRSDTLKARIFSREGDPYNEETLRRDFQALWNTQFFDDVKLRVEDSPFGTEDKIVVFEVKERPVIRRIRYEGIHSVSESDILDRFKERRVGLTV